MMRQFQIHIQGQRDPMHVELDCAGLDQLVELASHSRFVVGFLAGVDESGCQPKVMIAASRISCAIELN